MSMDYAVLRIRYVTEGRVNLPPFKGSMVRGALGHALKQVSCQAGTDDCARCHRTEECASFQLFRANIADDRTGSGNSPSRPYALRCAHAGEWLLPRESLECEITLVGRAIAWAPLVALAAGIAGRNGFGFGRTPLEMVNARLAGESPTDRVLVNGPDVFTDLRGFRPHRVTPPVLPPVDGDTRLEIRCLSPLRWGNSVTRESPLDAPWLLRAAIRRIASLSRFWGDDDWREFPFGQLAERLTRCRLVENRTRWVSFSRCSSTQHTEIPVGGRIGRLVIAGVPDSLRSVLPSLEHLHVGKGAVWGFGSVHIRFP